MSRLIQKLSGNRGESLLESMVAILIFTLASIVMYSMVTSASDITQRVKAADEENQAQMIIAEQGEGKSRASKVTIELTKSPSGDMAQPMGSVDVNVFGGKNGSLYAYYVDQEEAGG